MSTYYDSETIEELFVWLQDLKHEDYVAIAIRCARHVLHLVPAGELRPLKAIEAAEAWLVKPSDAVADAAADAWAADHEKVICNLIRSVISERYTETEIAVCMATKRLQGVTV